MNTQLQPSDLVPGEFIDYKNPKTHEYLACYILEREANKLKIKQSRIPTGYPMTVDAFDQNIYPFRSHSPFREDLHSLYYSFKEFNKEIFANFMESMEKFITTQIQSTFTTQQIVNLLAGKIYYHMIRLINLTIASKQQMSYVIKGITTFQKFLIQYFTTVDFSTVGLKEQTSITHSHKIAMSGCLLQVLLCMQQVLLARKIQTFFNDNLIYLPENYQFNIQKWFTQDFLPVFEQKQFHFLSPNYFERAIKMLVTFSQGSGKQIITNINSMLKKILDTKFSSEKRIAENIDKMYEYLKKRPISSACEKVYPEQQNESIKVIIKLFNWKTTVSKTVPMGSRLYPQTCRELDDIFRNFKKEKSQKIIYDYICEEKLLEKLCLYPFQTQYFKYLECFRAQYPQNLIESVINSRNMDLIKKYIMQWDYRQLFYAIKLELQSEIKDKSTLLISIELHKGLKNKSTRLKEKKIKFQHQEQRLRKMEVEKKQLEIKLQQIQQRMDEEKPQPSAAPQQQKIASPHRQQCQPSKQMHQQQICLEKKQQMPPKQQDIGLNKQKLEEYKNIITKMEEKIQKARQQFSELQEYLYDFKNKIEIKIVQASQKFIELDGTPPGNYVNNHIVKGNMRILHQYISLLMKDESRTNYFVESIIMTEIVRYICNDLIGNVKLMIANSDHLTQEQKKTIIIDQANSVIIFFKKICDNMKSVKTKSFLEKRKDDLCRIIQETTQIFNYEYTMECVYYAIKTFNQIQIKEFKYKWFEFLQILMKKDQFFPNIQEKINTYKQMLQILKISNRKCLHLFIYLMYRVNQYEKKMSIIETQALMTPQVIYQLPTGLKQLYKCLDDEARVNKEIRNDLLMLLLKIHSCQFEEEAVETQVTKLFVQEMIGGIQFGGKTYLTDGNSQYISNITQILLILMKMKTGQMPEDYDQEEIRTFFMERLAVKKNPKKEMIENLERYLGELKVSCQVQGMNQSYIFPIKSNLTHKSLKYCICSHIRLPVYLYDIYYKDKCLEGQFLDHYVSRTFEEEFKNVIAEARAKQQCPEPSAFKGKRPFRTPVSILNITLKKSQNRPQIVKMLMNNIDILLLRFQFTNQIWERLPIENQQWDTEPTLNKLKKLYLSVPPAECFRELTDHEEQVFYQTQKAKFDEYFQWREMLMNEKKKKFLLDFYLKNIQLLSGKIKWILNMYCATSEDNIENNFLILQILQQVKVKMSYNEVMKFLQAIHNNQMMTLDKYECRSKQKYIEIINKTFNFIVQNSDNFKLLELLMEINAIFVYNQDDSPISNPYINAMKDLWMYAFSNTKVQEKISFLRHDMFEALYQGKFMNFRWLLLALEYLPSSEEIAKIFQIGMFQSIKFLVTKGSQRKITSTKNKIANDDQLHQLLLKFIIIAIDHGAKIQNLEGQHRQEFGAIFKEFLLYINENLYSSNGRCLLKIVEQIATDDLLNDYAMFFIKEMSDPNWMQNDCNRYSKRSLTKITNKFVGLRNPHSVCYMNSVIQQLFHIKQFRNGIFATKWKRDPIEREDLMYQFKKTFINLRYNELDHYVNQDFFYAFKDYEGNPTNLQIQMDVDEFKNILIDRLQNLIIVDQKKQNEKNFMQKIFNGKHTAVIQCKDCHQTSKRQQGFGTICLEVKNSKDITQSMHKYFETEILDGDNSYFCEKCKKKVTAFKSTKITEYPLYLTFVLKRFDYHMTYRQKINTYFEFSLDQFEIQEGVKYILKGIIVHQGLSEAGHYFSLIKIDGKWYEFNDQNVEDISEKQVKIFSFGDDVKYYSRNAYVLFYEKADKTNNLLQEQPQICEGLQKQQKEIYKNNKSVKKVAFYYSDYFRSFIQLMSEKNLPNSDDMILAYTLLVKAKNYSLEYIDIGNLLNYLKKSRHKYNILKNDEQIQWILRFYQSKHVCGPIKMSLTELILNNYEQFTQQHKKLLEHALQGLTTQNQTSQYFQLFYHLSKKDEKIYDFLIKNFIVARILNNTLLILGSDKQEMNKETSIPIAQLVTRKKDYEKPQLKYHKWKLLNYILEKNTKLHPKEEEILYKLNHRKLKLFFQDAQNKAAINQVAKTCRILSEKSQECSRIIKNFLIEILTKEKPENIRRYLKAVSEILKIEDTLRGERLNDFKNMFRDIMKNLFQHKNPIMFDIYYQWLIKIAQKNEQFRNRIMICKSQFNFLENRTLLGTLYFWRAEHGIKNEERHRNRVHGLTFPTKATEVQTLLDEKLQLMHQILDIDTQFRKISRVQDPYDSDADLTKEELNLRRNDLIGKYDEKLGKYLNVQIKYVFGDYIFTYEDAKIDRGDERYRERIQEQDNLTDMDAENSHDESI